MRTIDVVSTSDQNGKLEATVVRFDQKLGTSLGSSIWVGRFQDVLFRHGIGVKVFTLSVHFIS